MEHATEYGGDPSRIGITGDSAGGHLAASAGDMCDKIGDRGYGLISGIYEFKPSYIPENKSISEIRVEIMKSIKAVAPSYGVFSEKALSSFPDNRGENNNAIRAVSPICNIPNVKDRAIPHYLLRGTKDPLITNLEVKVMLMRW